MVASGGTAASLAGVDRVAVAVCEPVACIGCGIGLRGLIVAGRGIIPSVLKMAESGSVADSECIEFDAVVEYDIRNTC
ncbi:hypothetical protein D3C84_1236300 [compost metagenome]